MMYSDKLVCTIKHNGKILRESKDTVYIPFGSEYSIFIKNLNTVRCRVDVTIDGASVGSFIVNANSSLDLERFVEDLDVGNRFKFIERTNQIENHRGIKSEDGLIQLIFEFEKPYVINTWQGPYITKGGWNHPTSITCSTANYNTQSMAVQCSAMVHDTNDVGITVRGSESNQKFVTCNNFTGDGVSHTMVIKLLGEVGFTVVKEPVTVHSKIICDTCGKMSKATQKFCGNCGTALRLPI